MKVALFNAGERGSGAEDLVRSTAAELAARGIDTRLYVRTVGEQDDSSLNGRVHPLRYLPGERWLEKKLRTWSGWNDLLFPSTAFWGKDPWLGTADLWHFHNLHGHFVSIPLLGRESRRRRIILSPVDQYLSTGYCCYTFGCRRYLDSCGVCPQVRQPWPGISRDSTRFLLRMKKRLSGSDVRLLLHTDYLARHYHESFWGGRAIDRLHYGIDTHAFHPMDREFALARFGFRPKANFAIGLFHSYVDDSRKGIFPILSELRSAIEQSRMAVELYVVGHGSDRAIEMQSPCMTVNVLPFLSSVEDLAHALSCCDVLLYPTQAENLSLTCLKALACGVPVISSRVGGQGEAIRDGVNGFLHDPEDTGAFVNRVLELIRTPDLRRRLALAARASILNEFSLTTYVDRLLDYYHEQMDRSSLQ